MIEKEPPFSVPLLVQTHLDEIQSFFEKAPLEGNWFAKKYRQALAHYYRLIIPPSASILEVGCGSGELLEHLPNRDITGIDLSFRQIEKAQQRLPHGTFMVQAGETLRMDTTFDFIILSETANFAADVQLILKRLRTASHSRTRLIINFYNTLWRPILTVAKALGLKQKQPASNWLSTADLHNILDLAEWQIVHKKARILVPFPFFGLDRLVNRTIAPLLQPLCLTVFLVARPRWFHGTEDKTVSVVIPARNESGNIEAAILRTPELGKGKEIIFVEGNSKDNTWEEIQRIVAKYSDNNIKAIQQTGKGKGNAVREGFRVASGDILIILDADLTMPPEELPKFYEVLRNGQTEFANGVRLVYPMEKKAMRFINMCGNKLFSLAFSWLLGQPLKDTLCGTKALFKEDYERIAANRSYFGEFDPFGDFDLIFGASKLHLKITDVPIRYRERVYGDTNIQRWRHGWLLIRMVFFAARKIRFV
jgi:SAM-dependent methyltransferase